MLWMVIIIFLSMSKASLWEQACPHYCTCMVKGWQVLKLDAKTVDCTNVSLIQIPENVSIETEVLILRHNIIGHAYHFSLLDLVHLRRLLLLDLSFNRIRSLKNVGGSLTSVRYLNLSYNCLSRLDPGMFRGFPHIEVLNIRYNRISLIAPLSMQLPKMKLLDLSNNKLSYLRTHYFADLHALRVLMLSNNHIGRISEPIFRHTGPVDLIDLDGNRISKFDENSLNYITSIGELRLSNNHLGHVPTESLSHVSYIDKLTLNNNYFRILRSNSFRSINVSELFISNNEDLFVIESRAFSDLYLLSHLEISDNKRLTYVERKAFNNLPLLRNLDLRNNNLLGLREDFRHTVNSLKNLTISGNPFWCTCDLKWLQEVSLKENWVEDGQNITCTDPQDGIHHILTNLDDLPSVCPPLILPLFPEIVDRLPANNVSFRCAASGVPSPEVEWILPSRTVNTRWSIRNDVLYVSYLHTEDSGDYQCVAVNQQGNDTRNVRLNVKDLNIIMIPVTVASTFVTLSWNRSAAVIGDYLLQYRRLMEEKITSKSISTGVKVHSYTLSGLHPGETYIIWLCLQRQEYVIRLGSLQVTTRDEGFLLMLGIRTNYLSVILVAAGASLIVFSCLGTCLVRLYKWRRRHHNEMVLSDNTSQRCFAESGSAHSGLAFMTFVNVADETVLVDNDDESFE